MKLNKQQYIDYLVEKDLYQEVKSGVQCISYQLITLQSTNGQSPFITLNMWINELPAGPQRDDLAFVIEEFLRQRTAGIKDEKGNVITIAFPKLIYVLDYNNTYPGSEYYYLTRVAAECTARRMVPDYVSAKMMRQLKLSKGELPGGGDIYPPMGCLDYSERISLSTGTFPIGDVVNTAMALFTNDTVNDFISDPTQTAISLDDGISLKRELPNTQDNTTNNTSSTVSAYLHNKKIFSDIETFLNEAFLNGNQKSVVLSLPNSNIHVKCNNKYTTLKALIMNADISEWVKVYYRYDDNPNHFHSIVMTLDHPLPLTNGKVIHAENLKIGDELVCINNTAGIARVVKIERLNHSDFSYDITTESEYFDINDEIFSHNCRSFLTPDASGNGFDNIANAKDWTPTPKYWGRFNQGVVTINLPDVALSSRRDFDKFWQIFEERLELCHKALRVRHETLLGTPSDVAPILWQDGAIARLKPGEPIDKLLFSGYSTISLGYAGLYECVKYMTGKSHTDEEAKPFALAIMRKLNDKCEEWKAAENIHYSVYGTPLESTTYKFAKCLQNRFGVIEGITDHNYITNSYHVNVREEIDAFKKLGFESEFQVLSPGGAISYVEVPNMTGNIEAVLAVMQYIYETIMYAELNTKIDVCQECGYTGEAVCIDDGHGVKTWTCPNCGNQNEATLKVVRRTCGYLGSTRWNSGRTDEITDRVLHL